MSEKDLTHTESLELITRMIGQAKSNFSKGGSYYFLLWGWVILLANLGHYIMDKFDIYDKPYLIWFITLPAIILTMTHTRKREMKQLIVGHLERMYGQVWMAVGVGIVITLIFMSNLSYNHNAVIMILAAIGTYVSGNLLRFGPLMMGGGILALTAVVCFMVPMVDQYFVAACGILVGYLIPGYILKRKENE